jgi:excisionase family DNA binding protein
MIDLKSRETDDRLETPKQLASRVGISERQVRHLIQTRRLEHVMIGCRVHIPVGAFARFLDARKVTTCQDEIRDRDFVGSPNAGAFTSPGRSMAGAASAQLARKTASKLKSASRNGSSAEDAEPAQVIPLRSS